MAERAGAWTRRRKGSKILEKNLPAKQEINRKYIILPFATSIRCIAVCIYIRARRRSTHHHTHNQSERPKFFVSLVFMLFCCWWSLALTHTHTHTHTRALSLARSCTLALSLACLCYNCRICVCQPTNYIQPASRQPNRQFLMYIRCVYLESVSRTISLQWSVFLILLHFHCFRNFRGQARDWEYSASSKFPFEWHFIKRII